ncbi:MAG: PLP-dependent aminotransferase family protein [Terriglobales bacterium]
MGERRGVRVQPESVLIVNGSQQAFDLTARVLLEEKDVVAVEEPHYFGLWQAFAAHGARLHPVPTDDEGLVCAALPRPAPRLVCVTPSHQFPAGPVLSLPRRLELLRYAEAKQCWILEDDYDSEFRYDSQPLSALRSLDQGHRVIYVGTFSKVMFGSLRLGYMIPPASLNLDFVNARYMCDMSSPAIEQAALANFMGNGGFARHLRQLGKALRTRRGVLLEGLRKYGRDRVRVADSHAGMHVVVWLPGYDYAKLDALIDHAHERGLGLYPMAPHYHTRPATPGLLLGYCGLPVTELREAMRLFGKCLDAFDAQRRS